ncbi:hypothetical protein BT96DRAFT_932716 [Gymnopus androsaceus JB14]|uniref:Uncharacterized protein n=1 Tax=Gymnopus androsaceus JB14 TaxID=1447944 RepID=A0A6A4IHF6_9AGAR|nr:hypothetical protein BT96DRAFT_932716 [Gymnopus androsaceus JB14]
MPLQLQLCVASTSCCAERHERVSVALRMKEFGSNYVLPMIQRLLICTDAPITRLEDEAIAESDSFREIVTFGFGFGRIRGFSIAELTSESVECDFVEGAAVVVDAVAVEGNAEAEDSSCIFEKLER